jgi:HK97 family phage major capsid protein
MNYVEELTRGKVRGPHRKSKFCSTHGEAREVMQFYKAASEGTNSQGGFLVPSTVENALFAARDTVGVARSLMQMIPMTRDSASVPKRDTGLTAYFTNENAQGTVSSEIFESVGLNTKKSWRSPSSVPNFSTMPLLSWPPTQSHTNLPMRSRQ